MPTGIRNLIGAVLLIVTIGLSSCLALIEAREASPTGDAGLSDS